MRGLVRCLGKDLLQCEKKFFSSTNFQQRRGLGEISKTLRRTEREETTWKNRLTDRKWAFGLLGGSATLIASGSLWQLLGLSPEKKIVIIQRPKTEKEIVDEARAQQPWRKWIRSIISTQELVYSIVGLNLAVLVLWRIPRYTQTMYNHFSLSVGGIMQGRLHTLVTSVFSHSSPIHLGFNTFVQLTTLSVLFHQLKPDEYATVFMVSGLTASFGSLIFKFLARQAIPSVGVSGALFGLFSWMCISSHQEMFTTFFDLTFSGLEFLKIITGLEIFLLCLNFVPVIGPRMPRIDHVAHLSGALGGLLVHYNTYPRTTRKIFGLKDDPSTSK